MPKSVKIPKVKNISRTLNRTRQTDRMDASNEILVAQSVPNVRRHARHYTHAQKDVIAIRKLNAEFRQRAP
jgi:hypothetical protein